MEMKWAERRGPGGLSRKEGVGSPAELEMEEWGMATDEFLHF